MALGDIAAKMQVPVFACGEDKRPITKNGFKDAVTDPARIIAMFDRPGAQLIGVPTGPTSNIVVIDIDIRADRTGMDWLNANADALPETRTHKTRSGGLHLVFRYPEGAEIRNSASRIAPGVDVRGIGGYVIVPPSPGYEVADQSEPADMPVWLIKACLPPPREPQPIAERQPPRLDGGSHYGIAALNRECDAVRSAPWGQQETTLNGAGLKIGALIAGGELQEGIAVADLISAGRDMASEPGREPWDYQEVADKVRRAVQDGMATPRKAPAPKERIESPPPEIPDDDGYWASIEADAAMSPAEWHELEQRESGRGIPASDKAKQAAGQDVLWTIEEPWEEDDIEPRPWIAKGYLMRGAVTVVSGPGSAGKSSLMVAWATTIALGCAFHRMTVALPMKVGTYNVEDDASEQRRRFSAMAQQLGVPVKAFIGNLAIIGPSRVGTLLQMTQEGRMLVNTPVMDRLEEWVVKAKPDVLILDPFVELHAQEENDNTAIRAVMARFRTMANMHNMSVVILHHSRKGEAIPGDPDSLRGASAIVGAARVVLTLNVMTEDEAAKSNVPKDHRRDFFRLDGAKSNYAPLQEAEWFERQVKTLANGDGVAVAWPWKPTTALKQASLADIGRALDRIAAGYGDGSLWRPNQRGGKSPRWVGNAIMQEMALDEEQAKQVATEWFRSGLLYETTYPDTTEGKERTGTLVNNSKRPA